MLGTGTRDRTLQSDPSGSIVGRQHGSDEQHHVRVHTDHHFGQPSRIQVEDMGITYRNRYSKAWSGIIAAGSPHADFQNLGKNNANDVFCKLVPFWQLELYFGKVLGRTPLQQADKGGFYPEVYEYARNKDYTGMTHGEIQLDFVYTCSKISGMNLLDFFTKWGFLTPVDKELDDYGKSS